MVNHFCLSVNNKLRNGCYTSITLAKLLMMAYLFLFLDLTQVIIKIGTFGIHLLLSVIPLLKFIFIMKKAALIFLSTFSLGATLHAQKSNTKINQIQVIGSHNSYRQALERDLYTMVSKKDTTNSYQSLQYEHIPISDQLNKGLRNLEIDVYADTVGGKYAHPKGLELVHSKIAYDPLGVMNKPGFKVLHMPDIDFRTSCLTLELCLQELKKWSNDNPHHTPIFITLEPKDGGPNFFKNQPEEFTTALFDQLDHVIINTLGSDKVITPDNVRGSYNTLEEAVLHHNWPSLKNAQGKFLFIMDNNGTKKAMYAAHHPSLKRAVLFINAEPGTPEAATLFRNDPKDATIKDLVEKGYLIRTRADADTKEARNNDYSRFEEAKKSGAQIITTDYYMPSQLFDSTYEVKFEDGTYVRKNPVNGK